MSAQPPDWLIESTSEFEDAYDALAELGGRLEEFQQSWALFLGRNPVFWTRGLADDDDDQCRVITYGDERLQLEYIIGLSLDRVNRTVLLRWIDRCPLMDPGW